jgi:hypothetical protein
MPRKKASRQACFYCGALVTKNLTGDHFPIPFNAGGVAIVPCCISCHDMKDRFTLGSWPAEWVEQIAADFPKLNRETRLFLAKCLRLHAEVTERKYGRNPATGRHHAPLHYETKFANFIKLCGSAQQGTAVVVAAPEAIGDSYGEIIESLTRLGKAGLLLAIAGESWHGEEQFAKPARTQQRRARENKIKSA